MADVVCAIWHKPTTLGAYPLVGHCVFFFSGEGPASLGGDGWIYRKSRNKAPGGSVSKQPKAK